MAFVDSIARMRNAQYATFGVPARWTPAGGEAVDFTALLAGMDDQARMHGLVAQLNMSNRMFRARVAELETLAPAETPSAGDRIDALDVDGDVLESFVIVGDPILRGTRRDEWVLSLADA